MTLAMAGQAAGTCLLARPPREREYLGFVAAARHVFRTRTVAALAALLRRAALFVQCRLPVRRFLPAVVNLLVTGLAGLGPHVF